MKSTESIHTQKKNSEKTISLKCPTYPENNYSTWARICLECMGKVSKLMGNILTSPVTQVTTSLCGVAVVLLLPLLTN